MTDALSYLHEKEKIIHNDLRCSNILVFQFPPINHNCLITGATSGCVESLPVGAKGSGVLVKVADMGICANPATQRTVNKQGIRRFVPECLNYNATLTKQVRVCLGSQCVYMCLVSQCVYVSPCFHRSLESLQLLLLPSACADKVAMALDANSWNLHRKP